MGDQKNLLTALLLSIGIIFIWQTFFVPPLPEATQTQNAAQSASSNNTAHSTGNIGTQSTNVGVVPGQAVAPRVVNADEAVQSTGRVRFKNKHLSGSINLTGAILDDVVLSDYFETTEREKNVRIFAPSNTNVPHYMHYGWVATSKTSRVTLPTQQTTWQVNADKSNDQHIELFWVNPENIRFELHVDLDSDYMFRVTHVVVNQSGNDFSDVVFYPYAIARRGGTIETSGFFISHEGPMSVVDGELNEIDYEDLDDDGVIAANGSKGWVGFSDKYWLSAIIGTNKAAQNNTDITSEGSLGLTAPTAAPMLQFNMRPLGNKAYQLDVKSQNGLSFGNGVGAQERLEFSLYSYVGAKKLELLQDYEKKIGADRFELAVDFGWFYFITKPLHMVMNWINHIIGNFGITIILITLVIKLFFFPLANASYRSMNKMRELQPKMKKMQELYADDRMKLNQEMMALYRKEKVNPAAGCLPILLQIPVFFALYKVLFVSIEMRHAPFFGWIQDLSAPDPTTVFNLFGLLPYTPPEFITGILPLGVWPLLMGISMWVQQKLNPQPTDPTQAKVFMLMPIIFTCLIGGFASGLVIYWTMNNILSIAQQWSIMQLGEKRPRV